MDKEDIHLLFQGFQIIVSLVGFVIIIFQGGKYIGTNDTKMEQLFNDATKVKTDLEKHRTEDAIIQKDINENLMNIRVALAVFLNDQKP